MPRASFSWTTFLVGASLAGALVALPAALQGCALLTCFPGDPGCDGAGGTAVASSSTSTGAAGAGGAGGIGGAGGTGGAGGGAGGAGGGAGCVECWAGECVNGECQPVLLNLPMDYKAQRIAATQNYVYAVVSKVDQPLEVMRIGFVGFQPSGGTLLPAQYSSLPSGIPAQSNETAFIAARGDDAYVSPQLAKGIRHCSFVGDGGCEELAEAVIPYNGLVLGNAFELADAHLFAVRDEAAWLGVTQLTAVAPFISSGEVVLPPGMGPESAGGSHALAIGPDGRFAWSLYGDKGCVAVGKPDALPACATTCLSPTDVANATGVAIDKDSQVFFLASGSAEYFMYRSRVNILSTCTYKDATVYKELGLPTVSQGVAVDDDHVYAIAKDPAGSTLEEQVVLRCSRTADVEDCAPIVQLTMSQPGGVASVAATPDGVFFASDTQIGWKHR